ncbi:MAG: AAA family ATPase, partial [Streptosporangiaceae bacterium]
MFVGRGEQLQALEAAYARAGAGEAGAVFVGGESGVGKTRLVMEFERLALAAGARFLVGGCVDVGGSELPYAPLLGALRTLTRDTEARVLAEMVGPGGRELGRLLPELAGAEASICVVHLNARDTTFAYASRACQPDIARLKERMGWTMPWHTILGDW